MKKQETTTNLMIKIPWN